jgi:hypothetical protein
MVLATTLENKPINIIESNFAELSHMCEKFDFHELSGIHGCGSAASDFSIGIGQSGESQSRAIAWSSS